MNELTGRLTEIAELLKFAAVRTASVTADTDAEVALRAISVQLINLARAVEDVRANALVEK